MNYEHILECLTYLACGAVFCLGCICRQIFIAIRQNIDILNENYHILYNIINDDIIPQCNINFESIDKAVEVLSDRISELERQVYILNLGKNKLHKLASKGDSE